MKKVLILIFIITITLLFAGCDNNNEIETEIEELPGLDFKSIRYSNTGAILSLGDTRELFISHFPNFTPSGHADNSFYFGSGLVVEFEENRAIQILVAVQPGDAPLFEFKDLSFAMTEQDISEKGFEHIGPFWRKFYDANGQATDFENGSYQVTIWFYEGSMLSITLFRL